MIHFYLDTSAVVKGYVLEPGSTWVRSLLTGRSNVLLISQLTLVEVSAAIGILVRTGRFSKSRGRKAYNEFRADVTDHVYRIVQAYEPIIEEAAKLAQIHPLKAYDAVQLATALYLELLLPSDDKLSFVSGDGAALKTAAAEGLATENPFDYVHLDR
jgi:predicted nucleic acid-binding protein